MRRRNVELGINTPISLFDLLSTTDRLIYPELQLIVSKSMRNFCVPAGYVLARRSVFELLARALSYHLSQCSPSQPSPRDMSTQARAGVIIPTCASATPLHIHS